MSSSGSAYSRSGSSSESGEHWPDQGDDGTETFDMFRLDPVFHPSAEYLERLKKRFDKSPGTEHYQSILQDQLDKIRKYRKWARYWMQPCSMSYHFEGDELFTGFTVPDGMLPPIMPPWYKPLRKDMDEWLSQQHHVTYTPKVMGIFPRTVNKFVWRYGFYGELQEKLHCIDLPPSTKGNPLLVRISEPTAETVGGMYRSLLLQGFVVLIGHDTVIAPKKDAPIFCDFSSRYQARDWQLLCFDITFMGQVFPPKRLSRLSKFPRFYGCTFNDNLILARETILVDCRGGEVTIWPCAICRFLNCKFEKVTVGMGMLLAKGCEFGTLHLIESSTKGTKPYYYLEDCTVGEVENAKEPLDIEWVGPRECLEQAFEDIIECAFKPVDFEPDD